MALLVGISSGISAARPAAADTDPADESKKPDKHPEAKPSLLPQRPTGFVSAAASAEWTADALPSNQADYGLSVRSDLGVDGNPFANWQYMVLVAASLNVDSVTGVSGTLLPENIYLRYTPVTGLSFTAGYMRLLFSPAQAVILSNSMFPGRPAPTSLFQNGADAGLQGSYDSPYVRVVLGVFDGISLWLQLPDYVTRGPVLSTWVDVAPFGHMSQREGGSVQGPLRLELGTGMLYRHASAYDATGYEALNIDDARLSVLARMSVKGFFAQGEFLYALQNFSLSHRQRITIGTYGELSYYARLARHFAISPLGRLGWSVEDATFFPVHTISVDAGLAFYPCAECRSNAEINPELLKPGSLRFLLQYRSQQIVEQEQTSYGVVASGLIAW